MQSVQEQPDEVPPQEVYPEKEMDTLPTEDPKTFDIQEWRQEWIKDPNNPAGGYWKKVPAGSTKYLKGFQTGGLLLTKPVRDAIQQAQEQSIALAQSEEKAQKDAEVRQRMNIFKTAGGSEGEEVYSTGKKRKLFSN
jgi:hypothetical protein